MKYIYANLLSMRALLFAVLCTACIFGQNRSQIAPGYNTKPQPLITFKATIAHSTTDRLVFDNKKDTLITVSGKNGIFDNTFRTPAGIYTLKYKNDSIMVYLDHTSDLALTADGSNFSKTAVITGRGAEENAFMKLHTDTDAALRKQLPTVTDVNLFEEQVMESTQKLLDVLDTKVYSADFTAAVHTRVKQDREQLPNAAQQAYKSSILRDYKMPAFTYENYNGGTTTLADFKDKYVYVTVWAAWHGNNTNWLTEMQKLEEKYKDKKIAFITIATDRDNYNVWRSIIAYGGFTGTHLLADGSSNPFLVAYDVTELYTNLLIGPDGKMIDADAQNPYSTALHKQLDGLLNTK
jgi:peroxiredoxin